PLLVLPAAVVNDTFRVLRPSLVGRRRTGGFERLLLSAGAGDDSGRKDGGPWRPFSSALHLGR
ncbi:MAG TPA: hypothetical protein VLX59_02865, partial [Acidimicrobiales bacterium]|nr:hypothetical protein [Acidimicrobiales bacterium]